MNRSNRLSRIVDRLSQIRKSLLTPQRYREAWSRFQKSGELPEDRDLRSQVERLREFEQEVDRIHVVTAQEQGA